ncbi:MAG: histidine kinase [Ignavibacteriaceae bacterium]
MYTNPVLQESKNLIIYITFWVLSAGFNTALLYFSEEISLLTSLADGIVFNFLLAGLGLSIWYPVKFNSSSSYSFYKILFKHIVGGFFFIVLWIALGYYIINSFFSPEARYAVFFANTLLWRFLIGILFYFLFISFYYLIIYYSGFQERTAHEAELKNLITEAELRSLKFQINPHFVFNSLNSMSALTTLNPEKAREMILKLADFLRYTLANNERQKNPLRDELKNIKLYLDIEKIRFEDKFEFIEEINEECLNTLVPNMILQPLFENAVKHAVYETLDCVVLKLKCAPENNFLKISLENNFDSAIAGKPGAGVGLQNIQNRLKLFYNMDNLMDIKKDGGNFKVTLFIPNDIEA